MSLTRLRRQDLHTCMCSMILIFINAGLFYFTERSLCRSALFMAFYLVSGILTGAFGMGIRKESDLLKRHIVSCMILFAVSVFLSGDIPRMIFLFFLCNIIYGCWLVPAKKWIRREICPGWTLLVYDSKENLEKAKAVADSRKDLMIDAYHCAYGGAEEWDNQKEKTKAVTDEKDIDHIIRLYRIPQMVICLDSCTEDILDYCKEAGITAFVKGKTARKGQKIDKEGLLYIKPVLGARRPSPGRRFQTAGRSGVAGVACAVQENIDGVKNG